MKKFKFPLQKVLEYNLHLEKKETDELAKMRAELNGLIAEKQQLEARRIATGEEYVQECTKGSTVQKINALVSSMDYLREQIALCEKKIEEQNKKIEVQVQKIVHLTKERTKIEKLKEQSLKEYSIKEQKSDELFIEEFVTNSISNIKDK